MIESAAEETSPQLGKYLLKSVTKDLSYEQLEYDTQYGRIPVGKTDLYGYRRKFFFILYQKKIHLRPLKKPKVPDNSFEDG